ncbi:hypothetical protein GIX81_10540, partial [Lactobacillus reuteri]|nr:hypothetical protein [Limosilactobacillus reuteri]
MKSFSLSKVLIAPTVLLSCLMLNSYTVSADKSQDSVSTNTLQVITDNNTTNVATTNKNTFSAVSNPDTLSHNDATSIRTSVSVSNSEDNFEKEASTATTQTTFKNEIGNTTNTFITDTLPNNSYSIYNAQLYSVPSNRYWSKDYSGWHFYESNKKLSNQWIKWGNYWYYLDGDTMTADNVCNVPDDGTFNAGSYCFDKDGHYRTNLWRKEYGTSRNQSGSYMYFGNDGRAVDGWQRINGQWYYFSGRRLITDTVYNVPDDGTFNAGSYCFDKNGHYRTNLWRKEYGTSRNQSGSYMYFGNDGRAVDGWQRINGQ